MPYINIGLVRLAAYGIGFVLAKRVRACGRGVDDIGWLFDMPVAVRSPPARRSEEHSIGMSTWGPGNTNITPEPWRLRHPRGDELEEELGRSYEGPLQRGGRRFQGREGQKGAGGNEEWEGRGGGETSFEGGVKTRSRQVCVTRSAREGACAGKSRRARTAYSDGRQRPCGGQAKMSYAFGR